MSAVHGDNPGEAEINGGRQEGGTDGQTDQVPMIGLLRDCSSMCHRSDSHQKRI